MRVGAMIVGILFAIWVFLEAALVNGLSNASNDEDMSTASGGGALAAILCGIGAVIVLAVPAVSMVLFALAGSISYITASQGYPNHWVYGTVFFGLALMSFFGWRGKAKDRREKNAEQERQRQRDDQLDAIMQSQAVGQRQTEPTSQDRAVGQTVQCQQCGHINPAGTKFCAECGCQLSASPPPEKPQPTPNTGPRLGFGETPPKQRRFGRS